MKKIKILTITFLLLIIGCTENKVDCMAEGEKILTSSNSDSLEFRKALYLFEAELKENPNNTKAQIALSQIYSRLSLSDSAIIVLSNSISKKKNDIATMLIVKGMYLDIKGNHEGAIKEFESSLKYNKKNEQAYNLIVHSIIWKNFHKEGVWVDFEKEDVVNIINEVYPENFESKPGYEEFINPMKM